MGQNKQEVTIELVDSIVQNIEQYQSEHVVAVFEIVNGVTFMGNFKVFNHIKNLKIFDLLFQKALDLNIKYEDVSELHKRQLDSVFQEHFKQMNLIMVSSKTKPDSAIFRQWCFDAAYAETTRLWREAYLTRAEMNSLAADLYNRYIIGGESNG